MDYPFRVKQLLGPLGGRLLAGDPETEFATFCIDSRYVGEASLFIPLLGQQRDGHHFVLDAFQKGARASLVRQGHRLVPDILKVLQESETYVSFSHLQHATVIEVRHTLVALQKIASWFRRQFAPVKVLAISGSVGKTQTKEMALSLLRSKHQVVGTDKNFNNEIGVPLTLAKLTPQVEAAVVEMAMRGRGEISLLSRIAQPNVALITNVLGSHIGRLGTNVEVAKAKTEIVDGMKPGDVLWLNSSDSYLPVMLAQLDEKQALRRGLELAFFDTSRTRSAAPTVPPFVLPEGSPDMTPPSSVDTTPSLWVEGVELKGLQGSHFMLCQQGQCLPVELKIPGRGAVANFTCAAALCSRCGMSLEECVALSPDLEPTPQRLVPYELRPGALLVDDSYNSSPASTQEALELIAQLPPKTRRILILGDMLELGKYETMFHRQVANQVLALPPSLIIAVGPRMAPLQEVPPKNGLEVLWYRGTGDSIGSSAGASPSAAIERETARTHSRREVLDEATIERILERVETELAQSQEDVVILVKGSRALHLERVVRGILAQRGIEERML